MGTTWSRVGDRTEEKRARNHFFPASVGPECSWNPERVVFVSVRRLRRKEWPERTFLVDEQRRGRSRVACMQRKRFPQPLLRPVSRTSCPPLIRPPASAARSHHAPGYTGIRCIPHKTKPSRDVVASGFQAADAYPSWRRLVPRPARWEMLRDTHTMRCSSNSRVARGSQRTRVSVPPRRVPACGARIYGSVDDAMHRHIASYTSCIPGRVKAPLRGCVSACPGRNRAWREHLQTRRNARGPSSPERRDDANFYPTSGSKSKSEVSLVPRTFKRPVNIRPSAPSRTGLPNLYA